MVGELSSLTKTQMQVGRKAHGFENVPRGRERERGEVGRQGD